MIIGITGSFGAGKGAVVEYLLQRGYTHYSAREFIFEEIDARGLPRNRESLILVGNDLRAAHEPEYVIATLFDKAKETGGDAVIESLRVVAEVRMFKERGGFVLGVDADPHLRYDRAYKRGSETDNVDFATWLAQEKAESNPDDPTKQDIFGALKESNAIVENNGTLEELYAQVDKVL